MSDKILFGLVGKSLDHSYSPLMFNQFFKSSGLNSHYRLFPLKSNQLQGWLSKIKSTSVLGFNVTIPYKEVIIHFLDDIDDEAARIGSINTVCSSMGKLKGYNTDYIGFSRALQPYLPLKIKKAVVLGAGGAARSVIYSLFKSGLREIVFFSRNREKIKKLLEDFHFIPKLKGYKWKPEKIREMLLETGLIINATPVGMYPSEHSSPVELDIPEREEVVAFDLVYNPLETEFLKKAKNKKMTTENGLKMLIYQALESYKIWKKKPVEEERFIQISEEVLNASAFNSR